ncbi:hypothetical protein ACFZAV_20270 [Streptomyces sp. NPDC008343]|uniref:hypothetical protein n=1 Tax=Streptomyces sp. NPDC008343 TaxID=3364828 RepID=UPI0036EA093B
MSSAEAISGCRGPLHGLRPGPGDDAGPEAGAITSIAGVIPAQQSVSVAIREDQTSGLALRHWVSANAGGA